MILKVAIGARVAAFRHAMPAFFQYVSFVKDIRVPLTASSKPELRKVARNGKVVEKSEGPAKARPFS